MVTTTTRSTTGVRDEQAHLQRRSIARALIVGGLIAGGIAGMMMAAWTMIAGATFRDFGFFTPMYLISSPFGAVDEARQAIAAAPSDVFYWFTGAALLGAAIHMVNSMMLGVVFGAVARMLRLRGLTAVIGGVVYGLASLVVMTFALAPLAEQVFGGAPYVDNIGDVIGWPTWIAAHVVFGMVLGLWPALRPRAVHRDRDVLTLP